MKALVSIITPVFNSEKYIEQTVQSVIAQTYTNWELIMVDDASTDNSLNAIPEDNRVKVIRLKKNSGSAVARNIGIKQAKGKYLTFIDSDDIWFPNFISKSIHMMKTYNTGFVFSSYKRFNEDLKPLLKDFIVPERVNYSDILKTNSISCLTAFLNIEMLGKKYMPEVKKRQDMGLWLGYLKDIPYAYGIKEPIAVYRIRKNSLSRNKFALLKSQWCFYREVEKLNVLSTAYYFFHWAIRGLIKYRK